MPPGPSTPGEHPVGAAVLAAAQDHGLPVPAAADFTSVPGRGVRAVVNGRQVAVGRPVLLDELTPMAVAQARAVAADAQATGHTAMVVIVDGTPVGVLALADRIRSDAVIALTRLTGARPMLLTGDNAGAAGHLAAEAGITDVHAGL
ncbi:HAD family hydrolase, partial [Micromonospora aurantiaca (nom. illeg.)]|uniref:HAD family hydrolase n=2 Tax=Micromonospora TaxID=1873 RepID=UPI003827FE28